jgi:hypothetical protein
LSALVDDASINPKDADDIQALLSPPQQALWQRVLPVWQKRPATTSYGDWLVQQIWPDAALKPLCIDLAMTLMFGLPFENGAAVATGATEQRAGRHFRGRFWQLVGGHPPGLSGGYYGHWTYPTEH